MRCIPTILVATLLVAAASAAIVLPHHRAAPAAHGLTPGPRGRIAVAAAAGEHHAAMSERQSNGYASIYEAVYNLTLAVQLQDMAMASAVLADDGIFLFPMSQQCGLLNKQQFLSALQITAGGSVGKFWMKLGDWAGYGNGAVGAFEADFMMVNSNKMPFAALNNRTTVGKMALIGSLGGASGNQLAQLEIWTDESFTQANATNMLNVAKAITAAGQLKNAAVVESFLAPDAQSSTLFAWDQQAPIYLQNKTAIVGFINERYAAMAVETLIPTWQFPACDTVASSLLYTAVQNDGSIQANKLGHGLTLNHDFQVTFIATYALSVFV